MKTVYIIWYKSEYNEGACYRGRDIFWTTDYNFALEYKNELEDNADNMDEEAKFSIVSFEVKK